MQKAQSKLLNEEKEIPTHVVAVFAFVVKNDKILLAKRSKDDPQAGGQWSIPGGKVDSDEGPDIILKTLKKEVMEEVGLEIENELIMVWDEGFKRVSGHHVVGLTFLCRWKKGIAKALEDQDEVRWVNRKDLENFSELPDYFKPRVKKLLTILR
jgi:ADP-ribose pyrophosphatase YjhB (NUDIX family)